MLARKALLVVVCTALCSVFLGSAPASATNDPYWSYLWGIRKVGADKAWSVGTGKGATIAVVDTGVDPTHDDLKRNLVAGYDFINNDTDTRDQFGHGTHVAGIAAAVANNGIGVAGVAPDAKIMPVRVLDSNGQGTGANVDLGIHWAADHGADVINLSLGDGVVIEDLTGGSMSSACDYAWSKGSICVIAAGNDSAYRTEYQQAKAIIVTATTPDNSEASYANGVGLAPWGIAAPGGTGSSPATDNILSTYWVKGKGDQYAYLAGTSMATPHVSGAVAILRGLGLTPQQTVDRLMATATDLGSSGNDITFGHGLLNVAAAVAGLHQQTVTAHGSLSAHSTATNGSQPANAASQATTTRPSDTTTSRSGSGAQSAAHTTSAPSRNNAGATTPGGFALFSPAPGRHGTTNGWTIGFVVLGVGAVGLGAFAYRFVRRAV